MTSEHETRRGVVLAGTERLDRDVGEGTRDQLDNDVQALSANLQDMEGSGMTIGGRIRTAYATSSDDATGAL